MTVHPPEPDAGAVAEGGPWTEYLLPDAEAETYASYCGRLVACCTVLDGSFMMFRSRPLAVVSAIAVVTSALIALRHRIQRSRQTGGAVLVAQPQAEEGKETPVQPGSRGVYPVGPRSSGERLHGPSAPLGQVVLLVVLPSTVGP